MNPDALNFYLGKFASLSRHNNAAPHKPILLLALLDEIQKGTYTQNFIPVTPELVASFRAYWRALVPPESKWLERMVHPFRYLRQDNFWELVKNGAAMDGKYLGEFSSLTKLNEAVDGGQFADDLWALLQDPVAINALRAQLLRTYFSTNPADVAAQIPADTLDYEAEKLKAEAASKYRVKKAKEASGDEGYYVRHALFPRVIKGLYKNACSVCGLNVYALKGGSLLDAAHIVPFAESHNDDPRNGFALCKNHHWGFDAGWFSVSDDYKIVVSPKLNNALTYITSGTPLRLPDAPILYPAPQAFAWHRTNKLQK